MIFPDDSVSSSPFGKPAGRGESPGRGKGRGAFPERGRGRGGGKSR